MSTPDSYPKVSQLVIQGVHALSNPNAGVVAVCPSAQHLVATAANSFAVVYDTSTPAAPVQVQQLRSTTSNQALQCVAWSCCGTHLAAGEGGSNASVFIWDVSGGRCVHELKAHKTTIARLCFSPDGKLLASIGCGADGYLCIWDWHTGSLLCKQKAAADLSSVAFTEDSSHILTAGKATLKSWSLTWSSPRPGRTRSSGGGAASSATEATACSGLSLTARQVNIKQQRSRSFVDMCLAPCLPGQPAGSNGVYALTDNGSLLLLRSTGRTVDRSINLQVQEAFALSATPKQVACACSQGVVRLFASKSLQFRANVPYWSAAGGHDSCHFADARACAFETGSQCDSMLLVVYSNSEMIMWDINNLAQIQPVRSFASHKGSIWDLCSFTLPVAHADTAAGSDGSGSDVVQGCATCGKDGTIQFWDFASPADALRPLSLVTAGLPSEGSSSNMQPASTKVQLRCMRISHDGQLLAAGDTAGNVHVYSVATLRLLVVQEAHDSDVLSLDFSPPPPARTGAAAAVQPTGNAAGATNIVSARSGNSRSGRGLAVSGSRDTLIHVYDAYNGFRLLETLDEHEAEVTAVRFTSGGRSLVSCGADHSIIFRVLGSSPGACSAYGYKQSHRETLQHTLLYDLVVDPLDAYVLTADQGGSMRMWDATHGSVLRSIQPEVGAGQVVRLCMDPGGVTAICCHSDGCVRVYDLKTGQLVWRAWGHASYVAAATVSPDLTRLVTVGGDGCVVVWKLPSSLTEQLQEAAAAVEAAKDQAGCLPASPQLLSMQLAASLSGKPTAPPGAAGAATGSGASTPLGAGLGAAGCSTTPGSCTSDGGISSTLKRLQQGKPLVSADKLPRWARSPNTDSSAGAQLQHASHGGAANNPGQQQQRRLSKWLSGRQDCSTDGQPYGDASDPNGQTQACVLPSARAGVTAAPQEQQEQPAPWQRGHGRVLVRHWQDGSSFSREAAAMAAAAAAAANQPGAAAAAAANQPGAAAAALHKGHLEQQQQHTHITEQQADLPGEAQQSPVAPGDGAVVCDLFKSHFGSLQQAMRAHKPLDATEEDDSGVQQDRQSLLAKFKLERSSLSATSSPVPDTSAASLAATDSFSSPTTTEQSTGLTPQGSNLFRAVHTTQPPPTAANIPQASLLGGAAYAADARAAAQRPCSQEPSPREKRWRQGQMKPELAGMWEKFQDLQAQFVQQQQQQQQKAKSPIRPKSSLGHSPPSQQQLGVARRRSDSSPGCATPATVEQVAQALQQQVAQALQQQVAQALQQQTSLQLPKSAQAVSSHALAADAKSPRRVAPSRPSATSRSSNRQPWASPSAVVSAAKRGGVPRSTTSSPPPSMGGRQQAAAAGNRTLPSLRPEGAGESPAPVFGSRTLARSLQRRRSSGTADDPAAHPAPAATGDRQQQDSSMAGGQSPVAAAPGAAAAAVTQDNSRLMAALFGDDSPAASPGADNSTQGPQDSSRSPEASVAAPAATPEVVEGAAASTPQAPNTRARLAKLLEFDSSPEAPSPARASSPRTAASAGGGGSGRSLSQSPTRRSLPRLEEVLRQGSSRSPSLSEPSDSSSPDRHLLRSPLASSCSPQQRQHGAAAVTSKLPSGIPSLYNSNSSSRKALQLGGQLDVSTECRVSIGTCIAARSPARTAAAAATSPLAQAQPPQQQQHATCVLAAVVADGSAAAAEDAGRVGVCSSLDLTPVPASGVVYTPKVGLGGALAAAGAAAAGSLAADLQQQQQQQATSGLDAVASKAGVTVTPAGGHQVWPAWGPDGAWEVTPSPAGEGLRKLWPPGGYGQEVAGHAADAAPAVASRSLAAGGAPADAGQAGETGAASSGGAAAGQEAPLLASGSSYWVAQNPCYDMTPQGSAGRSSKGLPGYLGAGDSEAPLSEASHGSSLQGQPGRGLGAGGHATGGGSAAGSAAETGGPAPAQSASIGAAGAEDSLDALPDGDRYIAYASGTSTPMSGAGRTLGLLPEHLPVPGTPGSACSSEPGSVASSRGGSKRQSSAGGGRFSGRGLQSLLGVHSPAHSGPDSDCRPSSPASSMLGLLQRMKKLSLPKGRSKSGGSSSAGGGCMTPRVTGDNDVLLEPSEFAHRPASKQQQAVQPGWSACTGGSGFSADDAHVDVEVSSRSAASVVQQTPPAPGACLAADVPGTAADHRLAPAQLAAKLRHFQLSALEILQVLQHPSSCPADEHSTREFDKLMTPPGQAAAQAQAVQQQPSQTHQQQPGSTCSSDSSSMPAVPLPQRVRQEVLQIVHELNAALGAKGALQAGSQSSTPGTPGWIAARGSSQMSDSLASSRACAAAAGALMHPHDDDDITAQITAAVLQRLAEQGVCGSSGRLREGGA